MAHPPNPPIPRPAVHPLDSERPFFSSATKAEGSDCASAFTGPLCFQMVLFSYDTVDTQHLPRIQSLRWGSTEGRWVVGRLGRGGGGRKEVWRRYEGTEEEKILGIMKSATASIGFSYRFLLCADSLLVVSCPPTHTHAHPAVHTLPRRTPLYSALPPPPAPSCLRHSHQ